MLSRVETFARGGYQAQGKETPAPGLIETASKMSYSLVEPTTPLAADRRSSRERFILCVLLLLGAIIWLPRLNGPLDLRWDAGTYYVLGTSLAEGRGYRLLNEPGNIESIQYPPLLPSVIAIYQLALGTSDPHRVGQALRFTFAFVFIAFVLTSYLILKRYLPTAYALLGALIVLVNPTTIVISDFCLSDLPFALISALFFLFQQNQQPTNLSSFDTANCGRRLQYAYGRSCLARRLGNGRPAQVHKNASGVSSASIVATGARMAILR